MKVLVIHHNADNDGNLSGLICSHFHPHDEVVRYGYNYGDDLPELVLTGYDKIYMVDVSHDVLFKHPEIIWIDHHKTAIEKYPTLNPGVRVDGVAACRLCWQYFTNKANCGCKQDYIDRNVNEPMFIRLAGEYDVWDKRDPNAELFNIGSYAMDIMEIFKSCLVDKLFHTNIIANGFLIRVYQDKLNESICKHNVHSLFFNGLHFACLNLVRGNSLSFRGLEDKYDAYMMWRFDGKKVTVSLYHAPGHEQHDLSAIAKIYGGGGHRGACGFQTTLENMTEILTTK